MSVRDQLTQIISSTCQVYKPYSSTHQSLSLLLIENYWYTLYLYKYK